MKSILRLCFLGAGLSVCSISGAAAGLPQIVNAKLETRSAAEGLGNAIHAIIQNETAPAWAGYAVPIVPGNHDMCCFDSYGSWGDRQCGRCALEENHSFGISKDTSQRVDLEGSRKLLVFFRVSQKQVTKIRTFSDNCVIDAGGLTVYWLTDVQPPESITLLDSYVRSGFSNNREGANGDEDDTHVASSALAAIALTGDGSADSALECYEGVNQPEDLRKKVPFWLGEARGRRGFEDLRKIVQNDPSEEVRKAAVFGLSLSHEPQAVEVMIDLARHDASSEVRGQALFWLAHRAGQKVAQTITEAIENDPETKVKKQAVFALTQLPQGQGVPLLIHIAQTNQNPAVRKQAMFWLGQSKDPRALAFFEEILTH